MKKILLIGSMGTIFLQSYRSYFKRKGYNVIVLNTSRDVIPSSADFDLYECSNSLNPSFFRKYAAKLRLDKNNFFWNVVEKKEYSESLFDEIYNKLEEFIIYEKVDIVFAFWGTTLKKEIKALYDIKNKLSLDFKIVLSVNTYPVRYEFSKDVSNRDLCFLKRDLNYFNYFDALVCPTENMADLIKRIGYGKNILILPDFLDSSFFCQESSKKRPNSIVFLGNVNFSNRRLDDVSSLILSIAEQGVAVFVQEPCNIIHENIKTFKPFSFDEIAEGKLAFFISSFTASIVTYNEYDNLRTSISFPTRFALATLGGRPFILPKKVFDGIEKLLDSIAPELYYTFGDVSDIKIIVDKIDASDVLNFDNTLFYQKDSLSEFIEFI